jgi:hypothetical protein
MSRLLATAAVAISLAVSAAELRGPLPILSVPYHDDGALENLGTCTPSKTRLD